MESKTSTKTEQTCRGGSVSGENIKGSVVHHQLPQLPNLRGKNPRMAVSKASTKEQASQDSTSSINHVPLEEITEPAPNPTLKHSKKQKDADTSVLPTPPASEAASDESPKTSKCGRSPADRSPSLSPTPIKLKIRKPTPEECDVGQSGESPVDTDQSTMELISELDLPSPDAEGTDGTEADPGQTVISPASNVRRTKTKGQIKKQLMKMKDRKAEQACERPAEPIKEECELVQSPVISLQTKDESAEYLVGDLKLARVSGHPYWPCMIAYDQFLSLYTRFKNNKSREYHVEFFGDEGERGWVGLPRLVPFEGKEAFEDWCAVMRKKNKKEAKVYSVPPSRRKAWEIAMAAATEALSLARHERKHIFNSRYEVPKPPEPPVQSPQGPEEMSTEPKTKAKKRKLQVMLENDVSSASTPPKKRQKRRQSATSASGESDPELSPSHIHLPEGLADQNTAQYVVFCQKRRDLVRREHPGYSIQKISEILAQQWAELDDEQRSKFIPMGSDVKNLSQIMSKKMADEGLHSARAIKPTKKKLEADMAGEFQKKKKKSTLSQPHPMASRLPSPLKESFLTEIYMQNAERVIDTVAAGAGEVQEQLDPEVLKYFEKEFDESMLAVPEDKKVMKGSGATTEEVMEDETSSQASSTKEETGPKKWEPPKLPGDNGENDYELEIFRLSSTTSHKKENICHICEEPGDLVQCEGPCNGTYHLPCLGLTVPPAGVFRCDECGSGRHTCFVCKEAGNTTRRCSSIQCGRYYHEDCIQRFPLTKMENNHITCSLHTCATCAAVNPKGPNVSKGRMYKCVRCPTAYHVGDCCIAAGSIHLAGLHIVCSRHFRPIKSHSHHTHINVSWCFICSKGGTLLCCESCPAAFHADCLKISPPHDKWYCADCARGMRPRYGDIVWVKLGSYRWWPGEICQPKHVPLNIQSKVHQVGEFPIRFFGSHDYFWTHQARVFLFQEGDKGSKDTTSSNSLARIFHKAIVEATAAFKICRMAQERREEQEQERNDRKPAPYKHIKVNFPVGNVSSLKPDTTEVLRCDCDPNSNNPCGVESACLNRLMMYECHAATCPVTERCCNQRFTKREYPNSIPFRTSARGWGLKTLVDVPKGCFVNEYVGELIDEQECRRRMKHAQENNISNFYMLTLDKNRIIDAGPKGNLSRFMNHSCQPNCETQKWNVNGDVRVGLFASDDIKAGSELTFNYNLECLGNDKTVCQCGAANCSGFLGVRPKTMVAMDTEKKIKDRKKKRKLKTLQKRYDDDCYRCGEGGELVLCDKFNCSKVYHLKCLRLAKLPHGKWICPWHHCDECGKRAVKLCSECPNSFCENHLEKHIFQVEEKLVCSDHQDLLNAVEMSKLTVLHNDPSLEAAVTSSSEVTSSESSPTHSDGEASLTDSAVLPARGKLTQLEATVKSERRSSRAGSGYSDSDASEGRLYIVEDPDVTLADSDKTPTQTKRRGRAKRSGVTTSPVNTVIQQSDSQVGNGQTNSVPTNVVNTPASGEKRSKSKSKAAAALQPATQPPTGNGQAENLPRSKQNKAKRPRTSTAKKSESPMFDDDNDFPDLVIDLPTL